MTILQWFFLIIFLLLLRSAAVAYFCVIVSSYAFTLSTPSPPKYDSSSSAIQNCLLSVAVLTAKHNVEKGLHNLERDFSNNTSMRVPCIRKKIFKRD